MKNRRTVGRLKIYCASMGASRRESGERLCVCVCVLILLIIRQTIIHLKMSRMKEWQAVKNDDKHIGK